MKRSFLFATCSLALLLASCSSDEYPKKALLPTVGIPYGGDDFFESGIDFDTQADEKTFTFLSNVPWTISVDETRSNEVWCSVSPDHGEAGEANITVRVDENLTYDDRNAVLRIHYGDTVKNVFVNQKQVDAVTLTADRFEVPADGGTLAVEVKANIDYAIIIDNACQDWIRIKDQQDTRAYVSNILYFEIDPTVEYNQRAGHIYIKSKEKTETVSIYQAGEGRLSLTKSEFNLNSSEQNVEIEVNSNFEYEVEMPNVDWISEIQTRAMSTHTLHLHISKNEAFENRTATIRIYDSNSDLSESITINQNEKEVLTIEKSEYEIDELGGSFTIKTNSNVDYIVEIGDEWVTEVSQTRALVDKNHTFNVSPLTQNIDRETKIKLSDAFSGLSEEIVVKQMRSIFFEETSVELVEGVTKPFFTNRTEQSVEFESSNESVATIDAEGQIKAISKGTTTITATTQDKKHKCTCEIVVKEITDYVSASCSGFSGISINGVLMSGSTLRWTFVNNSSESVVLKTIQLIGGNGRVSDSENEDRTINANSSVTYTSTIGASGISTPVTCKFTYEYNGKEYVATAVYE